ncbi:hypothetical protein [Maridesulfovibrio sp.]|uniref:hypothetical protein n=1 Tax=unclassified Maridesulfovibrio TaxID=2794999 RepID=UPI0029CA961F|nr:hypothetical protein [Maridesulfovibrio sp.]
MADTKTCHKCGAENLLKQKNCYNCGEKLSFGSNIMHLIKMGGILLVIYVVAKFFVN